MEEFAPKADAVPVNVTFSNQIVHILETKCYICHKTGSGVPEAPDWSIFANIDSVALQKYNPTDPGTKLQMRVKSADPDYRMPLGYPPLSDEEIAYIDAWIAAGAPKN